MALPAAHIEIKLFASLRPYGPPDSDRFPVTPGQTVEQILTALGVPLQEVQLVFVNGVKKELSTELKGGERVGVFPPIAGG